MRSVGAGIEFIGCMRVNTEWPESQRVPYDLRQEILEQVSVQRHRPSTDKHTVYDALLELGVFE